MVPDTRPRAWRPLSEHVDLERIEWARSSFVFGSIYVPLPCPACADRDSNSAWVEIGRYLLEISAVDSVKPDVAI